MFSKTDTSLYLLPPLGQDLYRCGMNGPNRAPGPTEIQLEALPATEEHLPKLSLHETGQAHISIPRAKMVGPIWTTPLADFRGEHAASITADRLTMLPQYLKTPKLTGADRDIVLRAGKKQEACDVLIYANGGGTPEFEQDCQATVTLTRPLLTFPLFLGFRAASRPPLVPVDSDVAGVTILGAWKRGDPTSACLFIRGHLAQGDPENQHNPI